MSKALMLIKGLGSGGKKDSDSGNLIVKVIFSAFIVIMVLGSVASSFVSGLVGNTLDEEFVIEESDIYSNMETSWMAYLEIVEEIMDVEEERLIEEYEELGEEVTVTRAVNNINYAYILAYLTQTNDEYKAANSLDEVVYDEDKVLRFLKQISTIYRRTVTVEDQLQGLEGIELTEEEIEELHPQVFLYNSVFSPEDAANCMAADIYIQNNYIISFNLYKEWLGSEGIYTDGMFLTGDLIDYVGDRKLGNTFLTIPLYYQQDYTNHYSTGTIASDGCGPTSVAMVFSYLLQEDLQPDDVVDWTGDTYAYEGGGSYWSLFLGCAEHWGLTCTDLGKDTDAVLNELEAGHPVIASMGPFTFTKGGHFIVLCGTTEDSMFTVNDPNERNWDKYSTKNFDCNLVFNEAKNFWSFY